MYTIYIHMIYSSYIYRGKLFKWWIVRQERSHDCRIYIYIYIYIHIHIYIYYI
jgi:hypothetical protein